MSQAEFSDETGTVRLKGTLKGGGGPGFSLTSANGSIVITNPAGPVAGIVVSTANLLRENVNGSSVNIANNGSADLPWAHAAGAALLDYTNPLAPAFVATGVYAVTVCVLGLSLSVGGVFEADLGVDNVVTKASSPPSVAGNTSPVVTLTTVVQAGSLLVLTVANLDGASARDFTLTNTFVQRLF